MASSSSPPNPRTPAQDDTADGIQLNLDLSTVEKQLRDAVGFAQATYDAIAPLLDRVALIETKISTLISVLGDSAGGFSSTDDNEYRDMAIIIDSQAKIIQAMVSESSELSDEARMQLASILSRLPEFSAIESAKARVDERRQQRKLLTEAGDNG